jgi:hypothetical protein
MACRRVLLANRVTRQWYPYRVVCTALYAPSPRTKRALRNQAEYLGSEGQEVPRRGDLSVRQVESVRDRVARTKC